MKVRITKTVTVSDDERHAINHWYGMEGKANHETVRDYVEKFGDDFTQARLKYFKAKVKEYQDKAGEVA